MVCLVAKVITHCMSHWMCQYGQDYYAVITNGNTDTVGINDHTFVCLQFAYQWKYHYGWNIHDTFS